MSQPGSKSAPSDELLVERGVTVQATVSCSALIGRYVDRPLLVTGGYTAAAERLCHRLGWTEPKGSASTVSFSAFSETGAKVAAVPFVSGTQPDVTRRVQAAVDTVAPDLAGITLSVTDCRLNVYDFGVCTMDVDVSLAIEDPEGLAPAAAASLSRRFRAGMEVALAEEVAELTAHVRKALDADASAAFHSVGGATDAATVQPDEGRLLWIHTIYILSVAESEDLADRHQEVVRLLPSFHGTLELPNAVLSPGIQVSAAVCRAGAQDAVASTTSLARVMCELNAWWTATWRTDQLLFAFLHEYTTANRVVRARDLRRQAQHIEAVHEDVRLFRALLDTDLLNRAGRDRRIWDCAGEQWWLNESLRGIDAKLETLRDMHRGISDALVTRRARRFDAMLVVFTVFAVLGSLSDILGFLVKPEGLAASVRYTVMAAAALVAFLALLAARWVRPFTARRLHR